MLYLLPLDSMFMDKLPSPHELKGKILIKGKRDVVENEISDDSPEEMGAEDDADDFEVAVANVATSPPSYQSTPNSRLGSGGARPETSR